MTIHPTDATSLNTEITVRIIEIKDKCIPKTTGTKSCRRRSTPWWDDVCARVVENRRWAGNIINLKICEAIAKNVIINRKRKNWEEFVTSLDSKTPFAKVWRAIKSINSKQPTRTYPVGSFSDRDEVKASSLLEHFTRLNTIIQRESAFDRAIAEFVEKLPQEHFCVDTVSVIAVSELRASIQALKKTSPGEDCVSNVMLKKLPSNMFYELVSLFNTSLVSSSVPTSWKQGITVPVLKPSKDPASVSSYRPITMLSCIGKLMERIIQRRLDHFLESKHIFPPTQTGFRRGRSTTDVLAILKQEIVVCKLRKQYCFISYLDIDGAFDSVWHQGLLFKMKQLDIPQYILSWLCDYLTGRTIRARVGADLSPPKPLTRGLPQGAVLSPTLFNVMLSDIPDNENVKVLSYADDITLVTMAYDFQTAKGNMQNYLNELTEWLIKWKFKVNPQKCSFQIYTNRRIIPFTLLSINQQAIPQVQEQRVLGIVLDAPRLTMVPHIKYLKNDCSKRINVLRAISSYRWGASRVLLRKVYIAYIRSKIEYGCVIYGEFPASHMHKLDVIQNSTLRYILGAGKLHPSVLWRSKHISPLLR